MIGEAVGCGDGHDWEPPMVIGEDGVPFSRVVQVATLATIIFSALTLVIIASGVESLALGMFSVTCGAFGLRCGLGRE
jgi:hypothetical protein